MSNHYDNQLITLIRGQELLADIFPPAPVDITGWSIRFRIFRREGAAPSLTLTMGAGLSAVDLALGVVRVFATPAQTPLVPEGGHLWDLERTDGVTPFQMAGGPLTSVDLAGVSDHAPQYCPSPAYTPSHGKLFGNTFRGQRPTAVIPSGSPASIRVALYTPTGQPAVVPSGDGTAGGYCGTADIASGFSESVCGCPIESAGVLTDGGTFVTVEVPECVWRCPGVYELDVRANDAESAARALGRALVYVEPNSLGGWRMGPPIVDDVRMALRDYPAANRLLGDYEFSTSEIAVAVVQSIRGFNAALPLSIDLITSRTWPRDSWDNLIDGVMAELFDTAAAYYRRSHLPYSAGGVSVDDMAKEDQYLKAAFVHRERWQTWVKLVKMAANIESGFGSVHSDYSNVW